MVSLNDIYLMLGISLTYLLILPLQLIILPMQYYSAKDIIYSNDKEKAKKALISRLCIIICICGVARLLGIKNNVVIWGIGFGSFLCSWPSIYHYQLFCFFRNKYKLLYFAACFLSVVISCASAVVVLNVLFPVLFEKKVFYLLDNDGIAILVSIVSYVCRNGLRHKMKEHEQDNPYMIGDAFLADIYITKSKIEFEKEFFDQYRNEICESAEKYGIDPWLLMTVVQLETINRGSLLNRKAEKLAVKLIPNYLINRNATLGVAQVSIKNAKSYFHMAPQRYISEMIKPEVGIDLCAYVLKNLLDEYDENDECLEGLRDDPDMTEDFMLSIYIASKYVCGSKMMLKKYILVYATLINNTAPATKIGDI